MLKKYQKFKKIVKSQACCFYSGNILQNNQKVLIKRVKYKCTWNEVLKNNSIKLQSNQEYIPTMVQIFKAKDQYFIVYQKPSGINLGFFTQNIIKQIRDFYEIFSQFIESLKKLSQHIRNLYIYPQWLFMHRNSIKICHFQPYFQQPSIKKKLQKQKGKHVFMYDITRKFQQSSQNINIQQNGIKRIKNINFNLGYLTYHFLTGKSTSWQQNQQDYDSKIKQIQLNCRLRIATITRDQKLASIVQKLLKFPDTNNINYFDSEIFKQFTNLIKLRNQDCSCKKNNDRFRVVQFSLQKIKLQKKISKIRQQKVKKSRRPCCSKVHNLQQYQNPQQSPGKMFRIVHKRQNSMQQRRISKIFGQNSTQRITQKNLASSNTLVNKYLINGQKIKSSGMLPHLKTQRKLSLNQKLIKNSIRQHTSFSNKYQEKKTSKKSLHLKTEY